MPMKKNAKMAKAMHGSSGSAKKAQDVCRASATKAKKPKK